MQDYSHTAPYLAALGGEHAEYDFRAIHDSDKGVPGINRRGTITQHWAELTALNNLGYGIFVMVNATNGTGRLLSDLTGIRAHYADLDNLSAMENLQRAASHPVPPSFYVQTTPGAKAQAYWPLTWSYLDIDWHNHLSAQIIQYFDADKRARDAARVLRVPGFLHCKGVPHMVTFHWLTGQPVDVMALHASLAHVNVVDFAGVGGVRKPLGDPSLSARSWDEARSELYNINPNKLERDEWIPVMSAFKQAAWLHNTPEEIQAEFFRWCAQYETNNLAENVKQWASIRDTQIGIRGLTSRVTQTLRFEQTKHLDLTTQAQATPAYYAPLNGPLPEPPPRKERRIFGSYLSAQDQRDYFEDCFIITRFGKILTPEGRMMNETVFNARFGGHQFQINDGKTTSSAWEAVTRNTNSVVPKMDHLRFLPLMPPNYVEEDSLQRLGLNTWRPPYIKRREGDVTLYLEHVAKVIGNNPVDLKIFHDYIAYNIKFPGDKISWAPLIQSAEGVGKGVFKRIMWHCMGDVYCHAPNAHELVESGSKFNGWMRAKTFILCDEIRTDERREMIEVLKPLISERELEVQSKGVDQDKEDMPANWMFFSNWHDAIPVNNSSRRFAIFFSPLQSEADIYAAGMDDNYFNTLRIWLDNGGCEMIANYYMRYDMALDGISRRAPKTSSMSNAVRLSRSPIEKLIDQCIEDASPGFKNGWISVQAIQARAKERNIRPVPDTAIEQILSKLGYIHIGRAPRAYFQENLQERGTLYNRDRTADMNRYGIDQGYGG